jgi:hypothetical protein
LTGFDKLLSGGDLRSIGKSNSVISKVKNQSDFDELCKCLFHPDRLVVMRAADAIEKITISNPQYLTKHEKKITELFYIAKNIELKWHLALLIPRLHLTDKEFEKAWKELTKWAQDKTNSRLVRVSAIQGLFEMTKQNSSVTKDFITLTNEVKKENIPSINARIRNISKETY